MKLIQMQYSPDAFDSFIKQKLNEVEADSSLADNYWEKMNNQLSKKKGISLRNKLFYLSAFLVFVTGIYFVTNNTKTAEVPNTETFKRPPSVIEIKEVIQSKPSDEQLYKKNLAKTKPAESKVNKVEAGKEKDAQSDKTSIEKLPEIKDINSDKADIPIALNNKNLSAVPVISKDSMRVTKPDPSIQKKKKNAVSIIW